MSGGADSKGASASQVIACPDVLRDELADAEALWALLGEAEVDPPSEAALAAARAAVLDELDRDEADAALDSVAAREINGAADKVAGVAAPCPAELCEAVEGAEELWRVLGEATVPAPSPALLEQVAARIHQELDAEQVAGAASETAEVTQAAAGAPATAAAAATSTPAETPRGWLTVAAAVAAGFVGLITVLPLRVSGGWPWAAALALVAAGLTALVQARARLALLGIGGVAAAAAGLLAMGGHGGSAFALGCGGLQIAAAVLPLAVSGALLWRRAGASTPWTMAAAAAGGALAGQGAMALICPGRAVAHLLVSHAGAVLVAAMVGALAGVVLRRVAPNEG